MNDRLTSFRFPNSRFAHLPLDYVMKARLELFGSGQVSNRYQDAWRRASVVW